ncbi:hypothetical protein [Herbiconiux sp. 11R-BC]|uniref:hypothetical protein n=1 Tax=Herbiconiux sp. 11R-BC TaxID=3111637 RepID=UPI003C2DD644
MTDGDKTPVGGAERTLTFMVFATIGLSILAFLAILVATGVGVRDFSGGIWPTVFLLPLIGLPIGLVLMMVLLVINIRKRLRDARGSR